LTITENIDELFPPPASQNGLEHRRLLVSFCSPCASEPVEARWVVVGMPVDRQKLASRVYRARQY
jgi:hypothetical protein